MKWKFFALYKSSSSSCTNMSDDKVPSCEKRKNAITAKESFIDCTEVKGETRYDIPQVIMSILGKGNADIKLLMLTDIIQV